MEAKGEAEQESARRRWTILGNRRRAEQEEGDMVVVRMRQRAAATVIEKIDWQVGETIVVAWWGRDIG
jgi:predicted dinucleotide-binding enzyme